MIIHLYKEIAHHKDNMNDARMWCGLVLNINKKPKRFRTVKWRKEVNCTYCIYELNHSEEFKRWNIGVMN